MVILLHRASLCLMGGCEPIDAFGRLDRTFHALEKTLPEQLHPAKAGATAAKLSDLQSG